MDNYIILFEIKFYQAYLANYSMKEFDLVLTEQTLKILSSYQLRIKSNTQGFFVFGSSQSIELIRKAKEELTLDFGFKIKSPFLGSYTNIDVNDLNNKYYLTPVNNKLKNTTVLSKNEYLSTEDQLHCIYPYTNLENSIGLKQIEIYKDELLIYSGTSKNLFLSSIVGDDFGNFIVKELNTDVKNNLYYCASILANCFCIAEINLKKMTNFQRNEASFYEVRFENRSVIWNYIFVSRKQENIQEIRIFDGKNELNFSSMTQELLPNGQYRHQVSSPNPLPLHKVFNNLRMVAEIQPNKENKLDSKRIKLPTPDVNRLKGFRVENEEVYHSNMYVYY